MCRCRLLVELVGQQGGHIRNEFNHDKKPAYRQVPVEPIEVPSLRTNDPAAGVLFPQSVEADKVLND